MPIVEIFLLLEVSDHIGGWTTIGIIVLTAIIGSRLVKQQGLQTFQSAQIKLQQGQIPETELLEGFLILIAGILLVTPGFVTDFFGLLCLLPATRKAIAKGLVKHFKTVSIQSHFQGQSFTHHHSTFHQSTDGNEPGNVYEGEVIEPHQGELDNKLTKK